MPWMYVLKGDFTGNDLTVTILNKFLNAELRKCFLEAHILKILF